MNSDNRRNNRSRHNCCGRSRDCKVYASIVSVSTLIFFISMALTAYLTHIDSPETTILVLIVDSCLLYLLGFASSMYSLYYLRPDGMEPENDINSLPLSHFTGSSAEISSASRRPSDAVGPFLPEFFERTESSARELEITEEARKMIKRMYEQLVRSEQMSQNSADEQSMQQMVRRPKTPLRRQETMPLKLSQQNLVVQKQQTARKSSSVRGLQSVKFQTNHVIQQNRSPLPTQLDLGRLILGNEGISTVSLESPRIPGQPSTNYCTDQVVQQGEGQSSLPVQSDQGRVVMGNEGDRTVSPESSSRMLDYPSVSFPTDQVVQQRGGHNSLPTQSDNGRLILGKESISTVSLESSPRIPGHPFVSFRKDQIAQHRGGQSSLPTQSDQLRLIVGNEGISTSSPELSPLIHGSPSSSFRRNQSIQQRGEQSSLPTQSDQRRLILGNESISTVSLESSPRIPGHPFVSFRKDQISQHRGEQSSLPTQSDQLRLIVGNEGISTTSPELSPLIHGSPSSSFRRKELSPLIDGNPSSSFCTNQNIQQKGEQSSLPTQYDQGRSIMDNEGISTVSLESSPHILDHPCVSFRTDQVVQQREQSSLPTQSDEGRRNLGNEGIGTVSLESSPHILCRPSAGFHTDEAIQQKVAPSTLPTELDFGRLVPGHEGYYAVSPLLSTRNPDPPLVDFSTNQDIDQKVAPDKLPSRLGLEKIIFDSDRCMSSTPRQSPSGGAISKVAHRRKLSSSSNRLQTKRKMKSQVPHVKNSQRTEYGGIEAIESVQSTASNEVTHDLADQYRVESEVKVPSGHKSSVDSEQASVSLLERKQRVRTSSGKVRRVLSAASTRVFYQLGQSPTTLLDALGQCFDLTPEEWTAAWKMSKKGVPPNERAKILGVHLHEDTIQR